MMFCKNPNSNVPILEIYEEIGQINDNGFLSGISGREFAEYLKFIESQEDVERIDVYINSVGGSIIDGLTIYHAIKSCNVPVYTVCVGVAVSMAGIILQAGKRRQITKSGLFMMHDPSGGQEKELAKLKGTLVSILTERTTMTIEEVSALMSDTTWYDCFECLEKKLVDDIVDITSEANLPDAVDVKKETPKAAYTYLKQIVNKIDIKDKNPIKTTKMNKAKNFLNLEETASDEEMVSSIRKIKNNGEAAIRAIKSAKATINKMIDKTDEDDEDDEDSVKNLKKAVTDSKAAFKKMNDDMDAMKEENKKLKEENDALKNAKNELETSNIKAEADIKVQDAIDKGKVKAETKQKWVDLYIADKDYVIELLDGINSKPVAAKMAITSSKVPGANGKVSASNQLAEGAGNFLKARRQALTQEHNETHKRK